VQSFCYASAASAFFTFRCRRVRDAAGEGWMGTRALLINMRVAHAAAIAGNWWLWFACLAHRSKGTGTFAMIFVISPTLGPILVCDRLCKFGFMATAVHICPGSIFSAPPTSIEKSNLYAADCDCARRTTNIANFGYREIYLILFCYEGHDRLKNILLSRFIVLSQSKPHLNVTQNWEEI